MNQNKIKVLYITDSIRQRSGITSVIRSYLSHFDWSDIQVDILAHGYVEQETLDGLKAYGANVFFMPILNLKNVLKFRQFINGFFAEHKYDIVHSHYFQLDCLVFPIAKRKSGSICISHSHSTKLSDFKIKAIRNRLLSININRAADVWAACSDKAGETLFGKHYSSSSKRLIIRNGIECKHFIFKQDDRVSIREEFGYTDSEVVIGHIGRLAPQKNHFFMIDVFKCLADFDDKYRLLLIGDGPLDKEVREKVKQSRVENKVIFAGVRNDVPRMMNAFDLFLFPSVYEGLGIVAVEAQANGLKCVISDTVPRDVDLTGVSWLSIKDNPLIWAQHINGLSFERHPEYNQKVIDAKYDIQSAAADLQAFYKKKVIESKIR